MAEHIIIDNEYIIMKYLPEPKVLYHTIKKPIGGQPLRDALTTGLETLKESGASKWLSDDRKNGPMSDEDREWGAANLTPRAVEMGWKHWALVVPEQLVAAGSMVPTMEAAHDFGLRMMVFSEVDEAFAWLDSFED